MGILDRIDEYTQQGYKIDFYIVDQFENGNEDEMIWDYSVDSLDEGYELALSWLDDGRPVLENLL